MDIKKIEKFYSMISKEVYSEEDSELHKNMIEAVSKDLMSRPDAPKPGDKVIDMGCGNGFMLDKLVSYGLKKEDLTGVTMGDDDYKKTKEKGYDCHNYDMTFTYFEDNSFDYMIVRHCLEHSVWTYMTLMEFNRFMKMGSTVYVEMPAPEVTERHLEHFPNHYAIMGKKMWGSLMLRSGFNYISGTYPLTISDKSKPGKSISEPYDWYIMTKVMERSDYTPIDRDKIIELNKIIMESTKELEKK